MWLTHEAKVCRLEAEGGSWRLTDGSQRVKSSGCSLEHGCCHFRGRQVLEYDYTFSLKGGQQ